MNVATLKLVHSLTEKSNFYKEIISGEEEKKSFSIFSLFV